MPTLPPTEAATRSSSACRFEVWAFVEVATPRRMSDAASTIEK
jgi:hypothetical protein